MSVWGAVEEGLSSCVCMCVRVCVRARVCVILFCSRIHAVVLPFSKRVQSIT